MPDTFTYTSTSLDITVRIGCDIVYETLAPTPVLLMVRPRLDGNQMVLAETRSYGHVQDWSEFQDAQGNMVFRTMLLPGRNVVRHDALVAVSSQPEPHNIWATAAPVQFLPPQFLRYTLPSRYCDTDKLLNFAWNLFGGYENGYARAKAICDWTHQNIEYRFGSGRPDISASEVIERRHGVCRDFAHVAIALCRAFNIPARYVTGYVPDIGAMDNGTPMDFHAYFEAWLGGTWQPLDARHNVPRIGRVKIAQGLDAVDGAFATIYGQAVLTNFVVWAYQIDPSEVTLADPVDLSKRKCGTFDVWRG